MPITSDPGSKLRVFVSSKDRLYDDRELARKAIEDLGMEPILVEMEKWVATPNREEYLEQVRQCDLMVVLLEYDPPEGGTAEEEASQHFVKKEIELADLLGKAVLLFVRTGSGGGGEPSLLVRAMYDRVFGHKYRSAAELTPALQISLRAEIFRRYRTRSRPVADRAAFYSQAAQLVRGSRRRVYLGADTPVVVFGPRKRILFENDFFNAMMDWIESLTEPANADRKCVVFFNPESVLKELALISQHYDLALVRQNLERLDQVLQRGGNLQLLPTPGPHTFALFDSTYITWIRSRARWTGILDDSAEVCECLERLVHQMSEDALHGGIEGANGMDLSQPRVLADLLGKP